MGGSTIAYDLAIAITVARWKGEHDALEDILGLCPRLRINLDIAGPLVVSLPAVLKDRGILDQLVSIAVLDLYLHCVFIVSNGCCCLNLRLSLWRSYNFLGSGLLLKFLLGSELLDLLFTSLPHFRINF